MGLADVDAAYRRYFPVIRAKCRRMLVDGDEAQDVAQETFVRLWHAGQGGRAPEQVVAWIYKTCTRLAIDRLRERAARPQADEGARDAEQHAPAHDTALATRQLLRRLARRLEPDALELLVMHRLDGMKDAQIALVLGTSDRTVRRRLAALDEELNRIAAEV